ncbi:glycogen phosphorylase [Citrobacter koseri]|uniref:Glycogen phosphorylase n=1 Tax=Citrobacter koseri TaxID=545 RepID=A0A2X2WLW0_CITKO|nr:glycogen phosphorylase [Citrobacter koseri]
MNAPFTYASPTLSVEALKHSIAYKLMFTIGKDPVIANKHEWLNATLFAVRDRLVERWLRSNRAQLSQGNPSGLLPVDGIFDWPNPLQCLVIVGYLRRC